MTDDITNDLALLDDWLAGKGYGEEAGVAMRAMDLIRKQADEIEKLRAALRESDAQFMRVDKERMELRAECKWRPMNTAPRDGTLVLAAVAVFSAKDKSFLHWDIAAVAHDNGNAITTGAEDIGWSWEDFEFWKPISIPSAKAALGESDV